MTELDLSALLESWRLHLRAERKSAETIKNYTTGVTQFLAYCQREDVPAVLDRPTVNAFVASVLDGGAEAATARARQLGVRRFSAWLAEEGEVPRDELLGLKPPKLDEKITERLSDAQCLALIKACKPLGKEDFRGYRDEALVRFMLECVVRAGEVISMETGTTNATAGVTRVFGKGRKWREVSFGPQTARALDRYLRMRKTHRLADTPALWLGDRGKGLGYYGLYSALDYRAQLAGIENFHPHLTRHTAAQRWLAAGGSEGGLMAVAGWTRRDMLDRYTKATASERAAAEARSLNLGDFS
ncbi:tyrosine-type recombinase/integrase [Amycolatopsis sp. cmx-4-68]|uniref:tyrosine-type recombinase/integrase n=1 Tax=Amycolatopsis sp. cmx-4-68 TaxID=2790938 RepID=UPI00397E8363